MDSNQSFSSSTALEKAKQQHFDFLKKNNAITDAKNGELSLGAKKALDMILQWFILIATGALFINWAYRK